MLALPPQLLDALKEVLACADTPSLRMYSSELSRAYRGPLPSALYQESLRLYAYLASRMPATYAVACRVLSELAQTVSAPASLLDLGAGPGTVGWAAQALWPSLERLTNIEASVPFASLGKRLCAHSPSLAHRQTTWQEQNILEIPFPPHAILTASYVLSELKISSQEEVVRRAWKAANAALVFIEPGTPAGFETIIRARSILINSGAFILAPCPHHQACPKRQDNWCHFAQRLHRSSLHRLTKQATLPYEDEKFSYLIAVRSSPSASSPPPARIVSHPRRHKGHVTLELCTPQGEIEQTIIAKHTKFLYQTAKKSQWGDIFPYKEFNE